MSGTNGRYSMLGIVIVNYRDYGRTERFIREELSRITIPFRLVIADNGGSSEEAAYLQEKTGCTVLALPNHGFAAGCNRAATELLHDSEVDYILFTNTDLHLGSEGIVEALLAKMEENLEIGIIGPAIVGEDGKRQSPEPYMGLWKRYVWMYLSTPFLSKAFKRSIFQLDYSEEAREGFHYRVMGSFFICRAEDWKQVGGMDEGTFLYAEESILSERMVSIGKRTYFLPSVTVVHQHGAVIGANMDRNRASRLRFESDAYFYRKYKGYPAWQVGLVRIIFKLILACRRS